MDFTTLTTAELSKFIADATAELQSRSADQFEIIELTYNQYKGSGKAWIAEVDPQTKKLDHFLDAESNIKDGYKGTKTFKVPMIEGKMYWICEEGTKSYDSKYFRVVRDGKLEQE